MKVEHPATRRLVGRQAQRAAVAEGRFSGRRIGPVDSRCQHIGHLAPTVGEVGRQRATRAFGRQADHFVTSGRSEELSATMVWRTISVLNAITPCSSSSVRRVKASYSAIE